MSEKGLLSLLPESYGALTDDEFGTPWTEGVTSTATDGDSEHVLCLNKFRNVILLQHLDVDIDELDADEGRSVSVSFMGSWVIPNLRHLTFILI